MSLAVCSRCLKPVVPSDCTFSVDRRSVCTCPDRPAILSVGFITINATFWNTPEEPPAEKLAEVNNERKPVPDAFQNAFKDRELEL